MLISDPQILFTINHPELHPFLIEKNFAVGANYHGRDLTLEAVLDELEAFGVVALTCSPLRHCPPEDFERRCLCVVSADWSETALKADGNSRLLAALRCLMEVVSETSRQTRRGHDELRFFLQDK